MKYYSYYKLKYQLKCIIRDFFKDYLEVETPTLVKLAGAEYHLRYFTSAWISKKNNSHELFLRSSPEIQMKKLLALGYENIYQIGPCYRNFNQLSDWHNPEFTMIEWYSNDFDFTKLLKQTRSFIEYCFFYMHQFINNNQSLIEQLNIKSLPKLANDFLIISVKECFFYFLAIDFFDGDKNLCTKLIKAGVMSVNAADDFETSFYKAMLDVIEPELKKFDAVLLYGFPFSIGMLSARSNLDISYSNTDRFSRFKKFKSTIDKKFKNNDNLICAERVECYIFGIEITNGCMELTGFNDHKSYFESLEKVRSSLKYEKIDYNYFLNNYCAKIKEGTAGVACGLDRLLSVILGKKQILLDKDLNDDIYKIGS